ncbi:MAG: tetratricopeptide repeat protein [Acidocella sp.]|nr:tetratricopeptide repeat protein [Acidocella sp.]
MVDIFDEVSEDLRAEQAANLLKRYASLLIGAALLVLAGVGAQQGWQYYQKRQNDQAAISFIALTDQIDAQGTGITNDQRVADAKALVNFAATAQPGYRALATLRAAALYQDAGQTDAADALWNQVGADTGADPLLRDLGNLLWAQHALGTAPNDAVAARLQPLSAPENPYHALAEETQALLYLHEGKTDQAKALFSQISSDPNAPEAVRNRANGLLAKLNG